MCETSITVQIGSSSQTTLVLNHAGGSIFTPSVGQQTHWTLGTTTNPGITNVTSTASGGHTIFNLTSLGITTANLIVVEMNIINTNGNMCYAKDTLEWVIVSTLPFNPPVNIFAWRNFQPANFGTFTQAPFAVDWLLFTGKSKSDDVHLQWSTATKTNNEGFEVNVSTDSKSWENQ